MKIEKISDNQIRCTLSKKDLVDRELRISELAYGTEKAKALFRDMIQQASYQFGFEADDIPLMIEAIPVSSECLILVITKVEDPDELDTRFSKFSPEQDDNEFTIEDDDDDTAYADEVLNCFDQLNELIDGVVDDSTKTEDNDNEQIDFIPLPEAISGKKTKKTKNEETLKPVSVQTNLTKVFSFHNLEEVIVLAEHIAHTYDGVNSLYKDPIRKAYYLVIDKSEHTPEEFNKVCNIISEYGKAERTTYATPAYYEEHFECIVKNKAIQILCVM
ncbi:adaptor protein MecA [Velocimicrobium porci]|uniref:Adaptor protein MecA n=1 Tax=Velocimicrobium porci TaxID=2606634 RepID=A0A6L5XVY8_9FIRM|nr:adaptor protein MecA [Velocimicrobium porci]MSS62902.1 adaptor protein MecA [Velocimicrobium porci]